MELLLTAKPAKAFRLERADQKKAPLPLFYSPFLNAEP
jgi:hypothetical protein